MMKRLLGRTGHESTLITLGGAAARIGNRKESDTFIKYALDRGVNHIDVAPTYNQGWAEVILGKWVKEHRTHLFLAGKTRERTKKEAAKQLNNSLQKLKTEYFDLYQLHGLDDPGELKTALSADGALRAILEAKEQALVKYIGITSHNPATIMKALSSFDFDTVLLPVNYVLRAHPEPQNDYEPVLAVAKKRNAGIIAMKSVAKGPWPTDIKTYNTWYQPFTSQTEVDDAVRFTLSQSVTTITSSSDIRIAKMMIDAAERCTPMGKAEQQTLLLKASKYQPLFPRVTT